MKFRVDEITSVIREEIANYKKQLDVAQVGRVLEVGDGIAEIFGLSGAMAGEMLVFSNGMQGQVFNLEENSVGAVIYGPCEDIKAGDTVRTTGKLLEVPVGEEMLGRVIDPLGRPLDGGGPIRADRTRPVELIAPGIAARQPVDEPLITGIKAIDSMTPIGRGQRELIIGDRKTGKTAIAVDTIINQKGTGVICVYVAIGQKESTVAGVVETLRSYGAMDHTIVVLACSSDPAPLQYVAPYSGCTIAEHFMYTQGKATLVVYDDLTKQATAYRQISLLLRRPPGREAYPGDVFYLHSRLLERSCKLADKYVIVPKSTPPDAEAEGADHKVYEGPLGYKAAKEALKNTDSPAGNKIHKLPSSGGSLTALPICETQEGEVSAYIPTNLISITDGQIYLEPGLFFSGVRPAINVGISVSRVGYKAAYKAMKDVAKSLRLDLASYRELEAFAQLGMELDQASQRQLDRGARMVRLLIQPQYKPQPAMDQVIEIYAGAGGFLDDLPLEEVTTFATGLVEHVKDRHPDFYAQLQSEKALPKDREKQLAAIAAEFKAGAYKESRRPRRGELKITVDPPSGGVEDAARTLVTNSA
jgi:F-type H+-transporting ATPase subunit alpha